MGGVERHQRAVGTDTGVQVALPVVIDIGIHKLLQTLHISQQRHVVALDTDLPQLTMTILVGIGIHDESVVVDEVVMTVGIKLGIAAALPLAHRGVGEKDVRIDILHTAIGHETILTIPDVMRYHTRGGRDMHLARLKVVHDETGTLEGALIPAMKEGHIAAVG